MEAFSLAGRAALVTGATRGIGLATARQLAARGCAVTLVSRKPEACDAACSAIVAQGGRAIAAPGHAGREEDLQRAVERTVDAFGRLDIVVANAAINPVFDPLTEVSEESWQKILDMNVAGPLRLARHALPHVAAAGGGAMVLVSSINARLGMPGSGAYGISKAAVEQMVRQLAVEWGPRNVRVNAVAPGTTRTDMIRALLQRPGFLDAITATTPLRRIAEPDDIAHVIAFLAADAGRHVSGQVITVDGGQTIAAAAPPP